MITNIDECVREYFKDLKKIKPLTKEEEHILMKKYKEENDISARNKLIVSNLRYACKLASGFVGRGLTYYDLISEANSGLIDAIEKFDINYDVKLFSYAKWYIMQRMQIAIENKNKIPLSEIPQDDEEQFFDDDSIDFSKNLSEYSIYYEEDNKSDSDSNEIFLDKVLETLSNRELDMVNMYYGRNYNKDFTLEEIGTKYGLTKERVRQIIESSFKKIRTEAILVDNLYL